MAINNINKLVNRIEEASLDSVVIVPGSNFYYYTGIKTKQSERLTFLIVEKDGNTIIVTPEVEVDKFRDLNVNHLISYIDEDGPEASLDIIKDLISFNSITGIESGKCRVKEYRWIKELFSEVKDSDEIFESIVMVKRQEEIKKISKAVKILEESFKAVFPLIKPGMREIEVAARLEYEMKKRGSTGTPFETIVASGHRGASPHGRAGEKKIEEGELIIMDFGAIFDGYVGDISRTVAVGPISNQQKEVYEIVKKAQEYAVSLVRPGVSAHDIDQAARKIIEMHGYGDYFTHRTGHGIGLNAHEAPYIMQNDKLILEAGMTFTIEPGIYIKDKFGIRIEDNILVTESGGLNFMSLDRDLQIIQ